VTYYWYETQAPEGYLIPDDATTDVVTISAENAGTGLSVAAFLDPPLPTTPPPDLPDTGLSISPWLMGLVAAVLIATGGVMLTAARRRRSLLEEG